MLDRVSIDFRQRTRISVGAALHKLGLYRFLVPFRSRPGEVRRRLQAYLTHFYAERMMVEGTIQPIRPGPRFHCNFRDHMIEPYITGREPIYEWKEIRYFLSQVRPGDHILDIGANHGFWGFSLMARAGKAGKLHLVEANPVLLERLRATAALNPDLDVTIHAVALNDGSSDRIRFYTPAGQLSGLGSIVAHDYALGRGYLDQSRYLEVAASSLDRLISTTSIERIDLLKIDVEQGEDLILVGAKNTLKRHRPRLIMVETSADSDIYRWLIEQDYQAFMLDENCMETSLRHDNFWGNIFFVDKENFS